MTTMNIKKNNNDIMKLENNQLLMAHSKTPGIVLFPDWELYFKFLLYNSLQVVLLCYLGLTIHFNKLQLRI